MIVCAVTLYRILTAHTQRVQQLSHEICRLLYKLLTREVPVSAQAAYVRHAGIPCSIIPSLIALHPQIRRLGVNKPLPALFTPEVCVLYVCIA